ncbi:HINT domain-containing protein [Saccharibacillus sp. O23]|uniref:HINT domain-containing protein n=1 Tax=Saccharibacillus sp. O23 TaxID=2009338 RepID=UPI00211AACB3|nr:HINT domain-containing protein [Saccharibacillus sp. O23]
MARKLGKESDSLASRLAKGCNCFTAGTQVKTDQGDKNIEDIQVGDKVLSQDDVTGEEGYKTVTATFNHMADEIYTIHVGDQEIESTYNHPFWVEGKGWTYVKDLKVGDWLEQADGTKRKIEQIEHEQRQARVYNMTVDEFHTYFVSDLGIWVHNTSNEACGIGSLLEQIGKGEVRFSDIGVNEQLAIAKHYSQRAPIGIPENVNVKAKSMDNGYEQITYT